jgi:protein phosphatase
MDISGVSPTLKKLHEDTISLSSAPSSFRSLIEDSIKCVKHPPRGGIYHEPGVIELRDEGNYIFIGDLHGDYYTLIHLLDKLWSNMEKYTLIFLGDYIDRGYMQIETLVFLLNLKRNYGDRIVLLRGNHEPPQWLTPYPHDYPYNLQERFSDEAQELYFLNLELFENLPLALLKENHFIALHGGPPLKVLRARNWEESFTAINDEEKRRMIEEILWSDPAEISEEYTYSPRGAGVLYGPIVSQRALQLVKGKFIIRGHEAVNGIRLSHDKRVITVFTSPLVYGFKCGGVALYEYSEKAGNHELRTMCFDTRKRELITLNNTPTK